MHIEKYSENVITMDEAVKAAALPDKQTAWSVEYEVLPEGASSAAYANFRTTEKDVASAAGTDQNIKEPVEYEALTKIKWMLLKIWTKKKVIIMKKINIRIQ